MESLNSSRFVLSEGQQATLANSALPSKTPVSLLHELAIQQGITPKYDLLQVEGEVHQPTFLYRATIGDLIASGQGQSKKMAKHKAARAALDQMLTRQPVAVPLAPPAQPPPQLTTLAGDEGVPGNPVGQLQELCISRRWPPPTYPLVQEEGLPHERTFTIACCIDSDLREIGVGKSKKTAKRRASSLMLSKLRDTLPPDVADVLDNEEDEVVNKLTSQFPNAVACDKPSIQTGERMSQFHRSLKTSKGPLITELKSQSLSSVKSPERYLQEIAKEQNFEITWVDIEEKNTEGRHQCLVQLSTVPVAVCYGTGDSPGTSRSDAAINALEYLQVMVQKGSTSTPSVEREK